MAGRREHGKTGPILVDPKDIRDLFYRPSLGLLPGHYLSPAVDPAGTLPGRAPKVRHQGAKPTCIGEALAGLIDIQRRETLGRSGTAGAAGAGLPPVSAAMLHAMALEVESIEQGREAREIFSLRSGLKGFYNAGVCPGTIWPSSPGNKVNAFDSATVEAMKAARAVTLGAYYRVRSFINDYHAAILEAGGLYVSAEIHGGWRALKDGVIAPRPKDGDDEAYGHAFVIVGYDREGFLVLNSWGADWGGYALNGGQKLPGIALWPYADWAENVLDAWALRLAAPTPESFGFAVGQHGAAMFGAGQSPIEAPSVRRLQVLGHYIHLDDGRHVATGAYPSSRLSLRKTLAYLATPAKADIRQIHLTIHGDIMETADVMRRVARSLAADRAAGVHGMSLIWANGLLSGANAALQPLFDAAAAISKGNIDDADHRIEKMTRPVGRALWRDVKRAAKVAAGTDGDATAAIEAILGLCEATGRELHLFVEGAGIQLLAALLRGRAALEGRLSKALESVTLVAPLITVAEYEGTVGRFLEDWFEARGRRAVIYRPNHVFDERLCVGAYSKSWTELVAKSFEDDPAPLIGAHDFGAELRGAPEKKWLVAPERPSGDLTSAAILQHEDIRKHARELAGP